MKFNLTRGVVNRPQKIVVYGPEGIGKSTFAAQFPRPLFIDTEGSTVNLDVVRLPRPSSWQELMDMVKDVARDHDDFATLVLDTVDWGEMLAIADVCREKGVNGIEDIGYGKGHVYVKERMAKLLYALQDVVNNGMNVVLTAHCQIRKFEAPDGDPFDRYELKLNQKTGASTAALVKEWSDMLLFVNYRYNLIQLEGQNKKHAKGGKRVMYAAHTPAFDAKNRCGLPDEMDFSYSAIEPKIFVPGVPEIPKELKELMDKDDIAEVEILEAINNAYPEYAGRSIARLPKSFIDDTLIGNWAKMAEYIIEQRDIPF